MLEDGNYVSTVESIQKIIQEELLNLVKDKVLIRQDGKELLDKQLGLIKILKEKINLVNRCSYWVLGKYCRIHSTDNL